MTEEKLTDYQKNLVVENRDLAHYLAQEHWKRSKEEMDLEEVVTTAYQGLIRAALKFDPTHPDIRPGDLENGKAFSGWARKWINGAILEWQRTQDHVPKRQRRVYKTLQQVGHGAGKSPEELADLTGLNVEKIRTITQAVEATAVSLDAPPESWDSPYVPAHAQSPSVEGAALVSSIQGVVADTFVTLPPLQRSVIVLRYYRGFDLTQIATELGVAVSVVRTSHREAIDHLHSVMRRAAAS